MTKLPTSLMWLGVAAVAALVGCDKGGPTSPSAPAPPASASCAFTVSDAPSAPIATAGADFTVAVTTSAGCSWSASSASAFIAPVGAMSGTGSGSVRFAVQANAANPRLGSVTVAGRSLDIAQDGPVQQICEWTVSQPPGSVPAAGLQLKMDVKAVSGADCVWTAASNDAFVNIQSGNAGVGSGSTMLQVAPNGDPNARVGTATIAGNLISILQLSTTPSNCAYTVSPTSRTISAAGGSVSFGVTKTQGGNCLWAVESSVPFLIPDGKYGLNTDGAVIKVPPTPDVGRSGTVVIAGHTVTITQTAPAVPCAWALGPASYGPVGSAAGNVLFNVTRTQGDQCPWTVQSNSPFLTIVSGSTGLNNGTVSVSYSANPGDLRTGTITAAGQTATLSQIGSLTPCTYRLSSSSMNVGAAVSSSVVSLSTTLGENCPWSAQVSNPFIRVEPTGGIVNNLNPMIMVFVTGNTGPARTGTVTLAPGIVLTVTQAAGLPSNAAAVVRLESDPADSVLHGQSRTVTLTSAQFETLLDPGNRGLTLNTAIGTSPPMRIRFEAPSGQSLASGYYDHAQRFSWSGQPGLDASYNGAGCNDLTGRLQINEASFGADGVINRFHARFEQHCGGSSAAMRGEVWIDAAGSTSPPPLPAFPATPATPTTVFSYQSDPGDVLGLGQQGTFTLANAAFIPRFATTAAEVNILVRPTAGSLWTLQFKAPSGQFVTPGTYDPAADPSTPGNAFLRVTGPGSCVGALAGKFTVLEAVYGTNGDVYRFRATFEARCATSSATLRGEIFTVADPWR